MLKILLISYNPVTFIFQLKRDLSIELGPYLNLYSRLLEKDTPRSIALARRTYQRSSINRDKVNTILNNLDILSEVNKILDDVENLKKNERFESEKFIKKLVL